MDMKLFQKICQFSFDIGNYIKMMNLTFVELSITKLCNSPKYISLSYFMFLQEIHITLMLILQFQRELLTDHITLMIDVCKKEYHQKILNMMYIYAQIITLFCVIMKLAVEGKEWIP